MEIAMEGVFKNVNFGPRCTARFNLAEGSVLYKNRQELAASPIKITDKLLHWAAVKPDHTFMACRGENEEWVKYSYSETLEKVRTIAQYLINKEFSKEDTVAILSENSIEHGLFSLGTLYAGIPYSPISPPYSLISDDFGKLKYCLEKMTPKVIFAQDGLKYEKALRFAKELFPEVIIICNSNSPEFSLQNVTQTVYNEETEIVNRKIEGKDIAKILFTSGSTGHPKGVINTHQMWCSNLQQITQAFPFMQDEPPVFIDWLPWNHTFGGNHNFGLTLYNGGTLYLDEGKPSPKGIETTVKNLQEIAPTAYFNVPKGFEMLIPYFENDDELRKTFFSKLNILFYAGASLAQPVWNKWEEMAMQTIGKKIPIITGLGCTESGPSAMFANWGGSFSGLLGVPVAGMEVKLVKDGDKLEARYKAPNVTPGYWKDAEETEKAFDADGFYRTGDAVKFLDENNPDLGLIFDGRIAEDFKLSTGTWVNVGVLKAKIISKGSPIIQDVVIAGLDQEFIGIILFLNVEATKMLFGECSHETALDEHPAILSFIDNFIAEFNTESTGSSNRIGSFVIALEPPSIDLGEITDKGSINQRAVLKHRKHLLERLFITTSI